jgi:hypothetical protein
LAWSPGFQSAVQRFVGRGEGAVNAIRNAGKAVALALGGPPDPPTRLPGGGWLFAACQAHDCPVKGALLLGPDKRLRGAGVFNFLCDQAGCADEPRLDLFLRDPHDAEAQAILTNWATTAISRDLVEFPTVAAKRLSGVRVLPAALR